MWSKTPSFPSGTGADVTYGTSDTALTYYFDQYGFFWVRGRIRNLDDQVREWYSILKERTGGVDPPTSVNYGSTPYEIARYYGEYLHWTDVLALVMITSEPVKFPVDYQAVLRNGYKVGPRNMDYTEVYDYLRGVRDGGGDYNAYNSAYIKRMALEQVEKDTVKGDQYSPYNPDSIYYDPEAKIYNYDAEKGLIIYQNGKIIDVKNGLTYIIEAQGEVQKYDREAMTITFESGGILNLKTFELSTPDGVIQFREQNPKPWYIKVFGKLLTDTKTQLIVLSSVIVLLIIKKRNNA